MVSNGSIFYPVSLSMNGDPILEDTTGSPPAKE
jgi:hypothetical protein